MMLKTLSALDAKAICRLDPNEDETASHSLMEKPAFAGFGAFQDDAMMGFIYGWSINGEGEVIQITVGDAHQRQGIGRQLLNKFIKEYAHIHCRLEVRADNTAAMALYTKTGFVEESRRKGYYQDNSGRTDAVLMRWP